MILNKISILNYKNLRQVEAEFSPDINCFTGLNGEGKTNLLDAVYYLSFCRSSNNSVDRQLILHGEEFFAIEGQYSRDGEGSETINCSMKLGHRKICRRNKKAYKRVSEHIGLVPLILVTPQDALLVESGSDERRRFMDIVISQYDPIYLDSLSNYANALKQRNALLKQEGSPDPALMELWEDQMAQHGEVIYRKRDKFITELVPYFQKIYETISSGKEQITLNYTSDCQRGALKEVISRDRNKDIAVGHSLHGVHRDDLDLLLDGYNMKREGSQGQHKTLVLSMKLAQFEFLRRTVSSTTPLLLLDDIFDKLDAQRVEKIISIVASDTYGQIFITDTNRTHIDHILSSSRSGYKLFHVENGTLTLLNGNNRQPEAAL